MSGLTEKRRLDRRDFLKLSGLALAGVGLQACAPQTPVSPTAPAAAPAAATKSVPTAVPAAPAATKPTGTLNWARTLKMRTRDPHRIYGLNEAVVLRHVMEPLLELDANGKFKPVLAESWKVSDDGLTWTFNLRKGVKFHDGSPFNAEAVKAIVERVKDNAKSGHAFAFKNYQDPPTRIVDEHTIEFKTKLPEPSLPYNLTFFLFPHPDAARDKEMTWEKAVGTGPYNLVEFDIDRLYRLEARTDYWKTGFPKIQTLNYRPILEQSSLAAAVRAGEFDFVEGLSPDNIAALANDPNFDIVRFNSWRLDFLTINQASPNPALKDARVRQAMAYAIDREVIARDILQGAATPWSTYPPKGIFGASDKFAPNPYDLDKARDLMKQSGFPNGFEATVIVPPGVGLHGKEKDVTEFIAQELKKLGIQLKVQTGEQTAIQNQMREGKHEIGYLSSVAVTGDPDRYFQERIVQDVYRTGYKNQAVNDLIAMAATTIDEKKRQAIYEEIQTKMWEDMPIVYLTQSVFQYVKRKKVTGFVGMPNQVYNLIEAAIS